MVRFATTLGLIAALPALASAAQATPVVGAAATLAVPAGKMIPIHGTHRASKNDAIACPPDFTKASACHLRQAEQQRKQATIRAADAETKARTQALD